MVPGDCTRGGWGKVIHFLVFVSFHAGSPSTLRRRLHNGSTDAGDGPNMETDFRYTNFFLVSDGGGGVAAKQWPVPLTLTPDRCPRMAMDDAASRFGGLLQSKNVSFLKAGAGPWTASLGPPLLLGCVRGPPGGAGWTGRSLSCEPGKQRGTGSCVAHRGSVMT